MAARIFRRRKRHTARRVLRAAFVLVVAVGVAGMAIVVSTDVEDYRRDIEQAFSSALGREVRVEGPIGLDFSLRPTIALADVTILDGPNLEDPWLARVGRLDVTVELLPLIAGNLRITRIVGAGAELRLAGNAADPSRWLTVDGAADREAEGPAAFPGLEQVRLSDVAVTYAGSGGETERLTFEQVRITPGGSNGLTALRFGGTAGGLAYVADVGLGPIGDLAGERLADWPVMLTASYGGADLILSGSLSRGAAGLTSDLTVELSSEDLAALEPVLGSELAAIAPLRLTARIVPMLDGGLEIQGLDGVVSGTNVTGSLAIRPGPPRLHVTGVLGLGDISIAGPATGEAVLPDLPLPRPPALPFDAEIDLAVGSLAIGPTVLGDLSAVLRTTQTGLAADILGFSLWGGTGAGRVTYARPERDLSGTEIGLTLELANLDLGRLLAGRAPAERARGRADGTITLLGRADGLRELVSDGIGRAVVHVRGADIGQEHLGGVVRSAIGALLSESAAADGLTVVCAAGAFDLAGGRLRSTALVARTAELEVGGEAAIDLLDSELEIVLRTRNPETGGLSAPLRIAGPFAHPVLQLDAADVAIEAARVDSVSRIQAAEVVVPVVDPEAGTQACAAVTRPPAEEPGPEFEVEEGAGDGNDETDDVRPRLLE